MNGQIVNVGFGGALRIPNIPASSNLVWAYAICTKNGKTRYDRSGFFQVLKNQSFTLSELDMVFRDTPSPSTAAIRAMLNGVIVNRIG